MSEVKFYRLATGEEVIATVVTDDESTPFVSVSNPMTIMFTQQGETEMYPLFPYCHTDGMKISRAMIEFELLPREELIEKYNKSFPRIQQAVIFSPSPTESKGCCQ